MPTGIMLILALYTLRDIQPTAWKTLAPTTLALRAAIGVHLKTRNAVVSVLGATVPNVALSTLWQT